MLDLENFSTLSHGLEDAWLCDHLDITPRTLRDYKSGRRTAPKPIRMLLRHINWGQLDGIGGKDWEGFDINRHGLFVPGFKYRFPPGEIKGFFFRNQTVGMLESEIRNLKHRIEELEGDLARETERAEKYRGIARTESRFGLIWERVVS